jgi:octopine/nopaline transport system substrate-binding protein
MHWTNVRPAIIGTKDVGLAKKPENKSVKIAGPCFQGGILGQGVGVGLRKGAKQHGTIKKLSVPVFGVDVTPQ